MLEIWIERADVNVELLDSQLRSVGSDLFYGFSAQQGGITLYMSNDVSSDLREQLEQMARDHDATQLTPQQQAAIARQEMLAQGRAAAPLDLADYAASSVEIQALASKIAWLEQEMRDLRGL